MAQAVALPKRSEVRAEDTWDAASVYPSDEAWEQAVAQLAGELPGLERFRGRLGQGPQALADWLATLEDVMTRIGKIYI